MWRYIYERQHAIDGSVKPWQLILHLSIALLVEIDDGGFPGGGCKILVFRNVQQSIRGGILEGLTTEG